MDKKELKKYLIIGVIIIGVCLVVKNFGAIGTLLAVAFSAAYPLLLGCVIAYVFNIFLSFCERHYFPKKKDSFAAYSRRPVCLVLSIAIMAAVVTILLNIIVPELITAIGLITSEIPKFAVTVKDFIVEYLKDYPEIQEEIMEINIDWADVFAKTFNVIKVGAGGLITSIAGFVTSLTGTVINIVVAIIFAIYLLLRKDKIRLDVKRTKNAYLNEKMNVKLTRIFHTANSTFRSFFVGQILEAIILGCLCMIGMTILKIPYAGMTGTIIGVTSIIPIVGAYIGAGVGAFIICTADPMKALIFIIFLVILQQFEGNVIYPKVVGSSVGLPGIWVLAGVTIGGGLLGVVGMLLGVPAIATVYKLYHEELEAREKKLGIESPKPAEKVKKPEKKPDDKKIKNNKK